MDYYSRQLPSDVVRQKSNPPRHRRSKWALINNTHVTNFPQHPESPRYLSALSGVLITWFIYRPLYILSLSLVKLSILAFYRTLVPLTVIPGSNSLRSFRIFRWTIYSMMVLLGIYVVSMILASIFQCSPVSAAYSIEAYLSQFPNHRNLPRPKCYKPTNLWAFSAIFNFTTDAIILLLPLPVVLSLRSMSYGKRAGVFAALSLG